MRLRDTLPALADLDQILEYIDASDPHKALAMYSDASRRSSICCWSIPTSARPPPIRASVALPTPPYPYLIFYEVADDEVIIHAVRHGARDPSGMPGAG